MQQFSVEHDSCDTVTLQCSKIAKSKRGPWIIGDFPLEASIKDASTTRYSLFDAATTPCFNARDDIVTLLASKIDVVAVICQSPTSELRSRNPKSGIRNPKSGYKNERTGFG